MVKQILLVIIGAVVAVVAAVLLPQTDRPPIHHAQPENPHDSGIEADTSTMGESELSPREQLDQMIDKDPTNLNIPLTAGNIYYDRGNFEDAVYMYERALKIKPDNPDVLVDAGVCYRNLGKSQKALEYFKKAIKLNPKHSIAYFNTGVVMEHDLNNVVSAIDAYQQYLNLTDNDEHKSMIEDKIKTLRQSLTNGK